jgi:hypothetical protein
MYFLGLCFAEECHYGWTHLCPLTNKMPKGLPPSCKEFVRHFHKSNNTSPRGGGINQSIKVTFIRRNFDFKKQMFKSAPYAECLKCFLKRRVFIVPSGTYQVSQFSGDRTPESSIVLVSTSEMHHLQNLQTCILGCKVGIGLNTGYNFCSNSSLHSVKMLMSPRNQIIFIMFMAGFR